MSRSGGGFASSSSFASAYASDASLGAAVVEQAPMKRTRAFETAPVARFRKPIVASGRVALKGTQAKKLRVTMQALFAHAPEAEWEALWPRKAAVTSEKLAGAGLAEVEHKPMLYWILADEASARDKNDVGKLAFIDMSGGHLDSHMVYPTVYALSVAPSLLRPLVVHAGVSSFILSGADCMWPGVVPTPDEEHGVGRFQRGERRALVARGNPTPFAVGWLSQDSASVVAASRTGRALSVVHCYQDELWKLGDKTPPNVGFVKDRVYAIRSSTEAAEDSSDDEEGEEGEEASALEGATSALGGLTLPADATTDDTVSAATESEPIGSFESASAQPAESSAEQAEATAVDSDADGDDAEEDAEGAGSDEDVASTKMSASEMDALLLRCFLYAVQTRVRDEDLPMDPSTLLTHMEACNLSDARLDVKRSTHKKMSKFLKSLGSLGLAKSKTGGGKQGMCKCELQVMSVSRTAPQLQEVEITSHFLDAVKRKQKDAAKQHAKGANATEARPAAAASSSSSGAKRGACTVLHMYRPDQKLQRFLFADEADAKKLYHMKDAKDALWEYTKANNLEVGQKIKLDPALYDSLYRDTGKAVEVVAKSDLSHKFDLKMIGYYAISFADGEDAADLKFKQGPLPSVEVSLEQRKARVMTKVSGLEVYGVDPMVFAKDAQKAFSCSTTTQTVPANAKHKAYEEVLIQGNCMTDVAPKLALMYGIPQQCVKIEKKKGK